MSAEPKKIRQLKLVAESRHAADHVAVDGVQLPVQLSGAARPLSYNVWAFMSTPSDETPVALACPCASSLV